MRASRAVPSSSVWEIHGSVGIPRLFFKICFCLDFTDCTDTDSYLAKLQMIAPATPDGKNGSVML